MTSPTSQSLSDIAAQCLVAHRPSFARPPLTEDKDFGDLVFRSRMAAPGVVLLRLDLENGPAKWLRLEAAIAEFGDRGSRPLHRDRGETIQVASLAAIGAVSER